MNNDNDNKTQPITLEKIHQMGGAFARIQDLKSQPADIKLVTPDTNNAEVSKLTREAELEALTEFLIGGFMEHASEYIGAMVALKTEYVPLCRALIPVVRHAAAQPTQAALAQAVQTEAAERPEKSNE